MTAVGDPSESRCGLCSRVLAEVDTRIESMMAAIPRSRSPVLLDVGCWDGDLTSRCANRLGAGRLLGVEVYEAPAVAAERRGIEVARIDLESERLPWPDASVDVVVCNQVLEHLKNIWLPINEMHRVLRLGGHAVLSVPNLASLHNRVLLAIGRQPTSIRVFGPHVRGYAFREFCELVERDGAFRIERRRGVGFYPVPSRWCEPLSAMWRGAAHTTLVLARKVSETSAWSDYISNEVEGGMQTYYGPAASGL